MNTRSPGESIVRFHRTNQGNHTKPNYLEKNQTVQRQVFPSTWNRVKRATRTTTFYPLLFPTSRFSIYKFVPGQRIFASRSLKPERVAEFSSIYANPVQDDVAYGKKANCHSSRHHVSPLIEREEGGRGEERRVGNLLFDAT